MADLMGGGVGRKKGRKRSRNGGEIKAGHANYLVHANSFTALT